MGPKRARTGESSSAAPTYDRRRFVSQDVVNCFFDSVERKTLIPERGLSPGMIDGNLYNMIAGRNWENFIAQHAPAVVNIVKEFYANVVLPNNSARVRGKVVNFSKASINAYYGSQDKPEDDEYTEYKVEGVNVEEVIRGLCRPGA